MITIEEGARIIVQNWLNVQRDEIIHFVADETTLREAEALRAITEEFGGVPKVTVLHSKDVQKGDVINAMTHVMEMETLIVGMTKESFITTDAVRNALAHGARFLSLPLATNDGHSLLEYDFMKMDPAKSIRRGRPIQRVMNRATKVHITTALGTDITFGVKGRKTGIFTGEAKKPGTCASASFEIYVAPEEYETNGVVILDGSTGYNGVVSQPVKVVFEKGYVTFIEDTEDGRKLKAWYEHFNDPEMYLAAELGIGLNEISQCIGNAYIEDESAYGTFHIGMGRNIALGGVHEAAGHFDIVTHKPTITTDAGPIMVDGVSVL